GNGECWTPSVAFVRGHMSGVIIRDFRAAHPSAEIRVRGNLRRFFSAERLARTYLRCDPEHGLEYVRGFLYELTHFIFHELAYCRRRIRSYVSMAVVNVNYIYKEFGLFTMIVYDWRREEADQISQPLNPASVSEHDLLPTKYITQSFLIASFSGNSVFFLVKQINHF
ncbi:hypothetical protein ALC53_07215, partial [Atta colombica]